MCSMSKTITIDDELYKKLAMYGNRDESHNTIIARLLEHINKDEAQEDRMNRETVFVPDSGARDEYSQRSNPVVEALPDGTEVRYRIARGDYAGEDRFGTVQGGRLKYDGELVTPTGMARRADKEIRGSDARSSEAYAGPRELEYQNDEGEWVPVQSVLEE